MALGHKVHVLYHGLPLQSMNREDRTDSGRDSALTVGRWSEQKGFLELVRALGFTT